MEYERETAMFTMPGRFVGVVAALAIAAGGAAWTSRLGPSGEGVVTLASNDAAEGSGASRTAWTDYLPVCSVPTRSVTLAKPFSAR